MTSIAVTYIPSIDGLGTQDGVRYRIRPDEYYWSDESDGITPEGH